MANLGLLDRIHTVRVGLIVLLGSLLLTTSYAQESKRQVFVLDDFSGGLNTKTSEFMLPKNQGSIVQNIRFDSVLKAASKRDDVVLYGTTDPSEYITGMHRMYLDSGDKTLIVNHGDQIDIGDDTAGTFTKILDLANENRRAQWTTWRNVAIGVDGYNRPVKYDGSSDSATYLGSLLATDKGSGTGPTGSDYDYKVTCYSSSYEFTLDQVSNTLDMAGNDLSLSMIPICPDTLLGETITGRKVYRNKDSASTYYLLSNGTIADNSTVILTDSDADAGLSATTYPAGDGSLRPPLGRLILIHNNRAWIGNDPSNPSRLYYSNLGLQDVFDSDGYLNIRLSDGDEITLLENVLGKLTVGKNNSIQKVYTEQASPDDWEISDPLSSIGCHALYSTISTPIGLIYLGNNGLYSFNGQYSKLISDQVTPEILDISLSNFESVWGEYYKNAYYMAYPSKRTGDSFNNRLLVYDLITQAFSIDVLSLSVLHNFNSGTDIEALYSGSSTNGEIYGHTDTTGEIIHNEHDDFAGTFDDFRYIPVSSGGIAASPILEIAWTTTIDEAAGTIDSATGIIDRPDTDGNYISQHLTIGASSLDKLYWNETIPGSGGDITFDLRTGATTTDCTAANWTLGFTDPTGSDVSGVTSDVVAQYRINFTANDIKYTPTIEKIDNYNVRLIYNTVGDVTESTVPFRWKSGWLDFAPGYKKVLEKIYVYYDWNADTSGTLNINFENLEGDTDTFEIDLLENPSHYIEYFSGGKFLGEFFTIDINETSLNPLTIHKIYLVIRTEPLI